MAEELRLKTIVVGAGPVGALAALYAAARGEEVEIYELRADLRDPSTTPLNFTKSINLALSERGINSLRKSDCPGLLDSVLTETIPMYGRMIHGKRNDQIFEQSQLYDVHGRFIRAVDRAHLNKLMLDELDKMPNVKFFFNHKLVGADFKQRKAWFERREVDHDQTNEIEVPFDFMLGADGAHSAVRYHLMKFTRMNYKQEYIDTLWCEFHIDPATIAGEHGLFKISKNHLHIWPAGEFMFIAIPSLDNTFTSTLFLPAARFAELDAEPDRIVTFFQHYFPGVVPDLISEENIKKQYSTNPHLPLISIKCTPYHFDSSVVILGDAAHAMVPFYGQGMNAGLEDVRVLFECLDKHAMAGSNEARRVGRMEALAAYTKARTPDAAAINDLALRNYQEMRSDVRSPVYLLRKYVEERLNVYFPNLGFATQYSRVSFGNERYSEVEKTVQNQGKILLRTFGIVVFTTLATGTVWILRWKRNTGNSRLPMQWISHILAKLQHLAHKLV